MTRRFARHWVIACIGLLAVSIAIAAELQPQANAAYDAYLKTATGRFLARVRDVGRSPDGREAVPRARPGGEDGIISVPDGLVHHWAGAVFLQGASLAQVLGVSCAYDAYSRMHRSVIASSLVAREGNDTYRTYMRIREGEAGVTAVLDVRSTVRYDRVTAGRVYAISDATEIREIRNAGRRDEEALPPGRDSGYLWRASTFSSFEQRSDGVYLEMETLGLSRRFPPLLGWIIEPIARRLGRRSIERSLDEFRAAVEAGQVVPGTCADVAASAS